MVNVAIPASAIALPTAGVRITGAEHFEPTGSGAKAMGGFCRVTAEIAPIDPAAPPIKLEANLPEAWNGKALMFGGGGFNGSIRSTDGTVRLQPTGVPIPLGRGYATFGSDSGHAGAWNDASFATNQEALRNYALDAVKKTRDAAAYLINARYGRPIEKLYFHGASNGGREAMSMIQHYPNDLDGAMVFWPAIYLGTTWVQLARVARAFAEPGASLNDAKLQRLRAAELEACDALDGGQDGVISNPRACEVRFDPATTKVGGQPLRCPSGTDEGNQCLSDVQIRALKIFDTPAKPGFKLAGGAAGLVGYNAWAADIDVPFLNTLVEQYLKYFVTRDPSAIWTNFDPMHPGKWQARLTELSYLLDQAQADLSKFRQHGGKILLLHGIADQILATRGSEVYYDQVVKTMGRPAVASFLRFYELPGTAHGDNGISFTPTWDVLGALDAWAEKGTMPVNPVVTDIFAVPGRTRPLCEYPNWPKYKGTGDINEATNFVCTH